MGNREWGIGNREWGMREWGVGNGGMGGVWREGGDGIISGSGEVT